MSKRDELSPEEFLQLRTIMNDVAGHLQSVYLEALDRYRGNEQTAMLVVTKHIEVMIETGKFNEATLVTFAAYMIRRSSNNAAAMTVSMN